MRAKIPLFLALFLTLSFGAQGILFKTNKALLYPASYKVLNVLGMQFSEELENDESLEILIQVYSDNSGDVLAGIQLCKKRAMTIKSYLVKSFNIDKQKIKVEALGAADPVADNNTAEGRSRNRRVEIFFKGKAYKYYHIENREYQIRQQEKESAPTASISSSLSFVKGLKLSNRASYLYTSITHTNAISLAASMGYFDFVNELAGSWQEDLAIINTSLSKDELDFIHRSFNDAYSNKMRFLAMLGLYEETIKTWKKWKSYTKKKKIIFKKDLAVYAVSTIDESFKKAAANMISQKEYKKTVRIFSRWKKFHKQSGKAFDKEYQDYAYSVINQVFANNIQTWAAVTNIPRTFKVAEDWAGFYEAEKAELPPDIKIFAQDNINYSIRLFFVHNWKSAVDYFSKKETVEGMMVIHDIQATLDTANAHKIFPAGMSLSKKKMNYITSYLEDEVDEKKARIDLVEGIISKLDKEVKAMEAKGMAKSEIKSNPYYTQLVENRELVNELRSEMEYAWKELSNMEKRSE